MNFQGMGCRRFCRRVSLSVGVLLRNWGRGPFSGNCEIVGGVLRKWSISLYRSSVKGTWSCKRRLWRWAPLSMGVSLGDLGRGAHMPRAYVWKKVLGRLSLPIGAEPGEGVCPYIGNFEN
jgi:hypothetical protein